MADRREYEPYSMTNYIKKEIELYMREKYPNISSIEAERLGCNEVKPLIAFLVNLYLKHEEDKK